MYEINLDAIWKCKFKSLRMASLQNYKLSMLQSIDGLDLKIDVALRITVNFVLSKMIQSMSTLLPKRFVNL